MLFGISDKEVQNVRVRDANTRGRRGCGRERASAARAPRQPPLTRHGAVRGLCALMLRNPREPRPLKCPNPDPCPVGKRKTFNCVIYRSCYSFYYKSTSLKTIEECNNDLYIILKQKKGFPSSLDCCSAQVNRTYQARWGGPRGERVIYP